MTGLDLSKHYDDVVRIVHSKFSGYDIETEDLVQDVCVKILRLNQGSSPYDPERSAPSTYIYMVAQGVVIKKYHRERDDVREVRGFEAWNETLLLSFEQHLRERLPFEEVLPRRVFLLLKMGYTRQEMSDLLGESIYQIRQQKKRLAELAEAFMAARLPSQ